MIPNILICGKTGAGKTSLIQAVTHYGTVPESAIGDAEPTTKGFNVYKTEIVNFIDAEGIEPGQPVESYTNFIMGEVVNRLDSNKAENLIHAIWYCVDGSGARVQAGDAEIIAHFNDKALIVVTKGETMRKEQTDKMMQSLLDIVERERIVIVSSHIKQGLKQLLDKVEPMAETSLVQGVTELEEFRSRWKNYYQNMQLKSQAEAEAKADVYIEYASVRAACFAMIPLPIADVIPLVWNEVYMIGKLADVYGIKTFKPMLLALSWVAAASTVGKFIASFIPFLGILIAAGITYGVGQMVKSIFQNEMTKNDNELKENFLAAEKEQKVSS